MRARETFGTSGPRLKVRFFALPDGGDTDMLDAPDMIERAYARGLPMGRRWEKDGRTAPQFLVWAVQDAASAPLERLQIIKSWYAEGKPQEAIYDIACADGSAPVSGRCADQSAGVDLSTCRRSGGGAGELKTLWTDPDYDPKIPTAYYVRVLETPKCRWSTWDAVRNGTPPNPTMPSGYEPDELPGCSTPRYNRKGDIWRGASTCNPLFQIKRVLRPHREKSRCRSLHIRKLGMADDY